MKFSVFNTVEFSLRKVKLYCYIFLKWETFYSHIIHFIDDILKWILLNENISISTKISLKFFSIKKQFCSHGLSESNMESKLIVEQLPRTITRLEAITWSSGDWVDWWYIRADSRLAPSQWEMSLQSNAISHWLGANLESALYVHRWVHYLLNDVDEDVNLYWINSLRLSEAYMHQQTNSHWFR